MRSSARSYVMFIALCLLASGGIGCTSMLADQILYPDRQPLPRDPSDYGLKYEAITFESEDGVSLAGWLMPGAGGGLIIMTHPGSFTRYGFSAEDQRGPFSLADEDVQFLTTAGQLVKAGYWVLTFDFRNHGESGVSPNGGITGVGLEEYRDVVAAVEYAKRRPELSEMPIGFVSFCQGANATIIAMSKESERLKNKDIRCLVAVQPISLEVFLNAYAEDKWVPSCLLESAKKRAVERGGSETATMSPLPYARDVFVPSLHVQATKDPWTDMDHVKEIHDALPEPKQMLWLDEPEHRFDTYNYFGSHPEPLLAFLEAHMGARAQPGAEPKAE